MMSRLGGSFVELLDFARTFRPLVLHDQQHAEAEFRHQRRRLRTYRRGIESPLGMRDWPWPNRRPRNMKEFALELELRLAQRHDDNLRSLRASPIGMRMPSHSTLAPPRPKPKRQRPPHMMSSNAMPSATRIGSCQGRTMTAVPNAMRRVRPAK